MKIINIILIISFYLEGIITNFINLNTKLFNPLFLFTGIILIYPLINNEHKYYRMCLTYGFIYDLVYTNTIFLHALIFLLIGYLISKSMTYFENNLLNTNITILISILIYRIINYILLCLVSEVSFNIYELLNSITSSIILNILYGTILYLLLRKKYINNRNKIL